MSTNSKAKSVHDSGPDLAGIAHDMRTPLSVIDTFLELAPRSENEDMKNCHMAAIRSVKKLLGLVEELRRPPREQVLELAHHDLAELARISIEESSVLAAKRGVDIRYGGPKHLTVWVEGKNIGRVLTNLVVNAVQASDAGGEVRVTLFVRQGSVFIEVADNGCGIDSAHLPKIFERGFTHGKDDGTGIGLDLCKHIVQEHGGTIVVYSKKEVGTVFVFSLPWALTDYLDLDEMEKPPSFITVHSGCVFQRRPNKNMIPVLREDTLD